MRCLTFIIAAAIVTTTARAAGWELHQNAKTGAQAAACTAMGTGPQGPVKATLILHHRRGAPLKVVKKDNVTELPIIIELCVDAYESVKGFDFNSFEGPDAPAASKRLISITIEAGKERFAKRFNQSGGINQLEWLIHLGEPTSTAAAAHDFTFGVGNPTRDVKEFITITKLLRQSPSKIEITVTDFTDAKRTLHFTFPNGNVGEVIGKLMR